MGTTHRTKRIIHLLFIALTLLSSCSQKPEIIEPKITLNSNDVISADYKASSYELSFVSNCDWTIHSPESWISISPAKGSSGKNTVSVSLLENPGDKRDGNIYIEYNSKDGSAINIHVTQSESESINISKTSFELPSDGGDIEITVKSQVKYSYTLNADWISTSSESEDGKIFKFHISSNDNRDSRIGIIKFYYHSSSVEVTVNQLGKDIFVLSEHTYDIQSEGGTLEVEVTTNAGEPVIQIPNDVNWIKDVSTKATQSYRRTLQVLRNKELKNRSTVITVTSEDGTLCDYISIVQAQLDTLFVDIDRVDFPSEGGEKTVFITANTDFSISTNVQWISASVEIGETESQLFIATQENNTNDSREAKISLLFGSNLFGSKHVDVIVTQSHSEDIYWGDVVLNNTEDVESFGAKGYKIVKGNFTSKVSMQKLCNTIEHIEGDVSLTLNYNIRNCDGLYGLKSIGGSFNLNLPLDHWNYGSMTEGLNNIQSIGNNFNLTFTSKNGRAESFEGLDELKTIGGDLNIVLDYGTVYNSDNTYGGLTFNGFNSLKTIAGSFILKKVNQGVEHINLHSFKALTSIGGDLIFERIAFDKSADNLSYLTNVSGNLLVSKCINEVSVAKNLQIVGSDVIIEYSTADADSDTINIFSSIISIGGNLKFIINVTSSLIKSIDAFRSLSSVKGDVYVDINNKYIESLCFRKVESMKSCWITSSQPTGYGYYLALNSIQFLSLNKVDNDFVIGGSKYYYNDIEHYRQLDSHHDTGIELLCPKLESVGGNFFLANFNGFSKSSDLSKLKTVGSLGFNGQCIAPMFFKNAESFISIKGGDLILLDTYINNDALQFFNKIDDSLRNVEIINNPSLCDFSPLVPIVTNMTGEWIVSNCAYNPTKYQMLNGQSKPSE